MSFPEGLENIYYVTDFIFSITYHGNECKILEK